MRTTLAVAVVLMVATTLIMVQTATAAKADKWTFCHIPPGCADEVTCGVTISTSSSAVYDAHLLNHGGDIFDLVDNTYVCGDAPPQCTITEADCPTANYSIDDPSSASCACVCDQGKLELYCASLRGNVKGIPMGLDEVTCSCIVLREDGTTFSVY